MFKASANGVMYVGQDPTDKGFVKMLIVSMSEEQVAAWLLIDPATATRYVYPDRVGVYKKPTYDNQPGTPLPKLKKHEQSTTAKATEEER